MGEDSGLDWECDFQLGIDLGSQYEVIDYPHGRPLNMKCVYEETDEDCYWSKMTLGEIIIPNYMWNWKVTWVCNLMILVRVISFLVLTLSCIILA